MTARWSADLTPTADVCVIGAGVMGLFTAIALRAKGTDVVVLDRGLPGCEASAANAGTLAVQNKPPVIIPLTRRAVHAWAQVGEEAGIDIEYERRGGFRLAHGDEDVAALERSVEAQQRAGLDVSILRGAELASAAPYLAAEVTAAAYCGEDGMANPLASTRALLRLCAAQGVRVVPFTAVTGIAPDGSGLAVTTTRGRVVCHDVVIAGGMAVGSLCALAGVTLPIRVEVLQVAITDGGADLFPHILTHVRGNLTLKQQRTTGKIMVGGGWKGTGDPQTGVRRVDHANLTDNLRWAVDAVPGIRARRVLRAWAGFEGRTPDKLLVVGPLDHPRGLHVVGCTGGGYTLAPAAGELAAAMVVTGQAVPEAAPFLPQRLLAGLSASAKASAERHSTAGGRP